MRQREISKMRTEQESGIWFSEREGVRGREGKKVQISGEECEQYKLLGRIRECEDKVEEERHIETKWQGPKWIL